MGQPEESDDVISPRAKEVLAAGLVLLAWAVVVWRAIQ